MTSEAVLGVVLQVGVPRGVDVLAVYANRSARYDNFAGATVAWERPDESLDPQIDAVLNAAAEAAGDTALMDMRDVSTVRFGEARVVLLMPDVARGVQGSLVSLSGNPRLGDVLRQGSLLMRALVAHVGSAVSV